MYCSELVWMKLYHEVYILCKMLMLVSVSGSGPCYDQVSGHMLSNLIQPILAKFKVFCKLWNFAEPSWAVRIQINPWPNIRWIRDTTGLDTSNQDTRILGYNLYGYQDTNSTDARISVQPITEYQDSRIKYSRIQEYNWILNLRTSFNILNSGWFKNNFLALQLNV